MNTIIGLVMVLGACALGFTLSGGQLLALWQPNELIIIGGAAFGALVMSNPVAISIGVLKGFGQLFTPSPFKKGLYLELLALMYEIFNKIRREGLLGIEKDIDAPGESPIFSKYPTIEKIHGSMDFIIDYLRVMTLGGVASHDLDALFDAELETHHTESHLVPASLGNLADGLPGFGIVAAVMGVVITMSHIGGDPAVLGHHVGAALVGTFLGILMSYGIFGPMSKFLEHKAREEAKFYECIKVSMMASFNGAPPQLAVEFGRKVLYHSVRPTWTEVEERVKQKPA
jgi:chemotaxis protein MotA